MGKYALYQLISNCIYILYSIIFFFNSSPLFSSPEQQIPYPNNKRIRLSIIYKNILNLADIKYVTALTKDIRILLYLFAHRKITKAGKIYLKNVIFNNFNIKLLKDNTKFLRKVMPYLNTENIKTILANLPKIDIEYQMYVVDTIVTIHCKTLHITLLDKIYSRYYKHPDFLDIISSCTNKNLPKIYTTFLKKRKISFKTYLYLLDEYSFKDIKKYLYDVVTTIPYTYLQSVLFRYPNIINYATKNIYVKFLNDLVYFKKSKLKVFAKKEYKLLPLHLLKDLLENIKYSKGIKQVIKLNSNFLTLFLLVKRYPHYISHIYKENLEKENFRFKLFLTFVETKSLSNFYILKPFYKSYEVYTYIKKLKYHEIDISAVCMKLKSFFGHKDKKLWNKICKLRPSKRQ